MTNHPKALRQVFQPDTPNISFRGFGFGGADIPAADAAPVYFRTQRRRFCGITRCAAFPARLAPVADLLRCKVGEHGEQSAAAFWRKVLQNEEIALKADEPGWLDRPAMMRILVSSPAVVGRLKKFCKPYDFVLAPVIREGDLQLAEEAEKPILGSRI